MKRRFGSCVKRDIRVASNHKPVKHASILLLTIGLCGLSFIACAEGDDSTFGNKPGGTGGEGGTTGTSGNSSSGQGSSSSSGGASSSSSSSSTGGGGACMVKCTSDTDCANGCKVPPVGINCCDVGTGTCYVSGADVCPSQGTSSGQMY